MRFGIFSNHVRSNYLAGRVTANSQIGSKYDLDIAEIVAADQLGYEEAWISEHTAFRNHPDTPPSAEFLIAKLAGLTRQIRMGPAVRRIALNHPLQIAMETATIDHLTGGRYMLGIGHGGPITGYQQRGISLEDSHPMILENIALVIRAMTETVPFDHEGRYYRGSGIAVWPKPLQQPYPPIAMASNTPEFIRFAAHHRFNLLLSQTARSGRMKTYAEIFSTESITAGSGNRRDCVIATRGIHVAESDAQALEEVGRDVRSQVNFNILAGRGEAGATDQPPESAVRSPLYDEWIPEGGTLDDISLPYLMDQGMFFIGSPDTVSEQIERFYAESGGFGVLLLVMGKDWGTLDHRLKSLRLFKEQVAPRFEELRPAPDTLATGIPAIVH